MKTKYLRFLAKHMKPRKRFFVLFGFTLVGHPWYFKVYHSEFLAKHISYGFLSERWGYTSPPLDSKEFRRMYNLARFKPHCLRVK